VTLLVAYHFLPVIIETLGALGNEAAEFLLELGPRFAAVTTDICRVYFVLDVGVDVLCVMRTTTDCDSGLDL
jgi:hypothetical protein